MTLEELLRQEGFETPGMVIQNTGETFEFFKHIPGVYEGILGKLNVVYKDLDGKKCTKDTPGAEASHAILDIFITSSPDGHGMPKDGDISHKKYGELMYKVYVTLKPDRQWQNKALFESFQIGGFSIVENKDSKDFKVNLGNFQYFLGRLVTFEVALSTKNNTFLKILLLADKSPLTPESFKEKASLVKKYYEIAEKILEKEKAETKKSDDDKMIEGNQVAPVNTAGDLLSASGLNPEDYI